MSSTFLSLLTTTYREAGISAASPASVVNQVGITNLLANLVADAAYDIETIWSDWDFLWYQWSESTISGTSEYSGPSDLGNFDMESFYLNYTSDSYVKLRRMDYRVWRSSHRNGTQTTSTPAYFIITPDNSVILHPVPNAVFTLTADYWKTPTRLAANTDTSPIPSRFDRAIIELAKMRYGENRGVNELVINSQANFQTWLKKLEGDQLSTRREFTMSAADDIMSMVVVPQ